MPALFECPRFVVRALRADEIPTLQALFEANPDYFHIVSGQPPRPNEAQAEFDGLPPAHLAFTNRWFAGVFDRDEVLKTTRIQRSRSQVRSTLVKAAHSKSH